MPDDYQTRFAGIARLYGQAGLERLRQAHVAVIGLGGVGSWTVEALARSGIGRLTLVDLDEVCLSNVNRQLPALVGTVGRFKAQVLAERITSIHPEAIVHPHVEFFTESSADRLLASRPEVVIDAIDAVANKCRLLAACRERGIPVFCCGGAGGRRDPSRLRIADLSEASHDRLLAEVRRRLRREHGFPASGKPMDVPCAFSTEPMVIPRRDGTVCAAGEASAEPGTQDGAQPGDVHEAPRRLNCEWGYGSASFVTGAFGFAAASWAVGTLTHSPAPS